jgi:choline kinase
MFLLESVYGYSEAECEDIGINDFSDFEEAKKFCDEMNKQYQKNVYERIGLKTKKVSYIKYP